MNIFNAIAKQCCENRLYVANGVENNILPIRISIFISDGIILNAAIL